MTVLPVPNIPRLVERYTGLVPPADLLILAPKRVSSGPEATNGSAIPESKIMPYSGIYDAQGKLPQIPGAGTVFMAPV